MLVGRAEHARGTSCGRAHHQRRAGQIVGSDIVDSLYANTVEGQEHIPGWLSADCFGEHYTRRGLDVQTRELVTLILIAALGGADPQVASHVSGNLNVGNGRDLMTNAVSAVLPRIGYPRTLNALRAIDQATS